MTEPAKVERRLDELADRISAIDKRFDDLRWVLGGAASLFALAFSVVTLLLSWNFNSEKDGLKQFETNLRADLGKADLPPELELLDTNNAPLANQQIEAFVSTSAGYPLLTLTFFGRNAGESLTGELYVKLYAVAPIHLHGPSTDEPKYQYEDLLTPKQLSPDQLPAKLSLPMTLRFPLEGPGTPPPGKYPCLVKCYYGRGKVAQAPFILVLAPPPPAKKT